MGTDATSTGSASMGAAMDRVMAMSWPSRLVEEYDGWLLRYAEGVTRRANSVFVTGEPADLEAAVAAAERFYHSHGAEPVFLISDASAPRSVQEYLQGCGYRPSATTWMLHGRTEEIAASVATDDGSSITVTEEPSDGWFDCYWSVEADRRKDGDEAVARAVLLQPSSPAIYVALHGPGDQIISVGQAVLDEGWACAQCLVTVPSGRRQGAGRQVVGRLAVEAELRGVDKLFAAVMADNEASLGLCEQLSLRRAHRYRYLVV